MPSRNRLIRGLLLSALLLGAQPAGAGVTYDFAFRTTDINGTPLGTLSSNGRTFTFDRFADMVACAGQGGCPVLDVIMRTTTPLISAGVSIDFDNSSGLAAGRVAEWFGQVVALNMSSTPVRVFAPVNGVSCGATRCGSFDGEVEPPPPGPPALPIGTYNIGTIIWDTSETTFTNAIQSSADPTLGLVGGVETDLTGLATVVQGFLLAPEAGTGLLLALGVAGLALTRRRRAAVPLPRRR